MPRESSSIGPVARVGFPLAREDARNLHVRLAAAQAVEARRVAQVLDRRESLEEGGLDRDAVDQPLHSPRLAEDVVTEDARLAAVLEQKRREQADQRRLARAVLAEDGNALAALDRKRDRAERRYATAA
jgi:hypothetical protein